MNEMYPSEEDLKKITKWPYSDFPGLMDFIKPIWQYSDWGYWEQEGELYKISTGGWSGNEDIIFVLEKNFIVWALYWRQSRRGGHYIFASDDAWEKYLDKEIST